MPEAINKYRFPIPEMDYEEVHGPFLDMAKNPEEKAFIGKVLEGFKTLTSQQDPDALFKLSHCLHHTKDLWGQLPQEKRQPNPEYIRLIKDYKKLGDKIGNIADEDDSGKIEKASNEVEVIDEKYNQLVKPESAKESSFLNAYTSISNEGDGYQNEYFLANDQGDSILVALNNHLEELYNTLGNELSKDAARRIKSIAAFVFKALTQRGTDNEPEQRALHMKELLALSNQDRWLYRYSSRLKNDY